MHSRDRNRRSGLSGFACTRVRTRAGILTIASRRQAAPSLRRMWCGVSWKCLRRGGHASFRARRTWWPWCNDRITIGMLHASCGRTWCDRGTSGIRGLRTVALGGDAPRHRVVHRREIPGHRPRLDRTPRCVAGRLSNPHRIHGMPRGSQWSRRRFRLRSSGSRCGGDAGVRRDVQSSLSDR